MRLEKFSTASQPVVYKINGLLGRHHDFRKDKPLSKNRETTPISVRGLIEPWSKEVHLGVNSDYKLVTSSGTEYFLLADDGWRDLLAQFSWRKVKLKGDLNIKDMTVVPKEIDSDDPEDKRAKVISLSQKKNEFLKRLSAFGAIMTVLPKVSNF